MNNKENILFFLRNQILDFKRGSIEAECFRQLIDYVSDIKRSEIDFSDKFSAFREYWDEYLDE